jgi:3-methyladenine DNA glycosylase AlkD
MKVDEIRQKLKRLGDKERAAISQRFFKTGPGEYGEGDIFLGIRVPELRKLAKQYRGISPADVRRILRSPIHEERLLALLILVFSYSKGDDSERKKIFELYLKNTKFINNWDLVDLSAGHIVGAFLADKDKRILLDLAKSKDLWERRISILATSHYIGRGEFAQTLRISKILLSDEEDLIHKAVGWMLREVGKRDLKTEEDFLKRHYKAMPRTMLRYAIERFPERKRQRYLKGTI